MPIPIIADVAPETNAALVAAYARSEDLRHDLERIATLVEQLIAERTHIREVLTTFYRSDITMSALQPILDLAREINPALNEWLPTFEQAAREMRDERPVRS